eukprot:TRINITY_DN37221_c0_g1_i1.p1 TRINITY_DN37221_c0_g1~~TRINITY_DN37221_c0_g1_i1.p1  ORF type:complete len:110 (-),score=9.17 TRINITY_DN37221_c0_g1_i1:34-363(-)
MHTVIMMLFFLISRLTPRSTLSSSSAASDVYKRQTWTSPGANFDNIGAAIMSVFTISTSEGWSDIMYDLMDSSSTYGDPMVLNNSPWGAVYAVIVVLSLIHISEPTRPY